MCRKVIETYSCHVCGSECTLVSIRQLWEWQKICSKACVNERWIEISDAQIAREKRIKKLKKYRKMMKKYRPNPDWKINANV